MLIGKKFAIRPTIRNHTSLKRDAVIKQIAELVGERHKVNLTKPDKVILVEIYQVRIGYFPLPFAFFAVDAT